MFCVSFGSKVSCSGCKVQGLGFGSQGVGFSGVYWVSEGGVMGP